ncbi:MAG TPA: molybdopterin-dependent oxidoreductase [Ilumatobacteraceae bacterium]
MTEHLSFCRICAAACGIVVTVEGETVVRVRGDSQHPVSRGYVCSKGRGLPAWHHHPARLDRPLLRGVAVDWDTMLDDTATAIRTAIDGSGADAAAMYLATGFAYDSAGQVAAAMWLNAIGSSSFYTAATVDNAPVLVAAELVAGNAMLNPVWDPHSPGLLVLVGTNPVVSHGYGTTLADPVRYLRDFRREGGEIWVVDPRRSESAALADEHLPIRPGADVALLAAVARELLADGADAEELCAPADLARLGRALRPFTVARAAAAAGVDTNLIGRLIDAIRRHPRRVAIMCGTGTTMATDGVLTEWLRWVILVLSGSLDREGGMRFNRGAVNRLRPPRGTQPVVPGPASRPELRRVAGQVPAVALVDEIESGAVRALVVAGGNPLTALPEPDRVRAALQSLDALIVLDVIHGDLCDIATHVLPATGQLERADLTLAEHVSMRSGVQFSPAVVAPGGLRRPTWWALMSLARRLGVDLFGDIDPGSLDDEGLLRMLLARSPVAADSVIAAGPRGVDVPIEHGWVRETMLPGGRWQVAPEEMVTRLEAHIEPDGDGLVLTPRREMAWSNSVRYGAERAESIAHVNPRDAGAAGLGDGDLAVIVSSHGAIDVPIVVDPAVRPGVVSVTHGRGLASTSRLTSRRIGVDRLTAMPHASGLPVAMTRAPADGEA